MPRDRKKKSTFRLRYTLQTVLFKIPIQFLLCVMNKTDETRYKAIYKHKKMRLKSLFKNQNHTIYVTCKNNRN